MRTSRAGREAFAALALLLFCEAVLTLLAPLSEAQVVGTPPFAYSKRRAVAYTWLGDAGDGNWSNPLNWEGKTVPGAGATAVFDANCRSNCSVTMDKNVNVAGIKVLSTFPGSITQASSTITIGSAGWLQAAGTFNGGSAAISLASALLVTGGTFTSTSGTLTITMNNVTKTCLQVAASATFNHNNGVVVVNPSDGNVNTLTIDAGNTSFYDLTLAAQTVGCCDSSTFVTWATVNGTVTVVDALSLLGGIVNGNWQTSGNLIVGQSNNGTGTVTMNGSSNSTYTYTGVGDEGAPNLVIAKTGGAQVSPDASTTSLGVYGFSLQSGSFTAPTGTMVVGTDLHTSGTVFATAAGTTFVANGGTVTFDGLSGTFIVATIAPDAALAFNNVNLAARWSSGCCANSTYVDFAISGLLNVGGALSFTGGKVDGAISAQGDVSQAGDGGGATLAFAGTGTQNWTSTSGPTGSVTVNNATGSVVLGGAVTLGGASQNLTITAGNLNLNGQSLTVAGTLTIGAGTSMTVNGGSYSPSSGARFVDSGTIN